MKLAVDTHHLLLEYAGTKRVTLNVLHQLRELPDIEIVELRPPYPLKGGAGAFAKIYGHLIRFFWVQIHLPILCLLKKVDFLLSPEFYTPLYTSCKRGVIAHDAHIRAQKEFVSPLWFYCYYVPFIERAIRRADLIFTVSQFSKKQVVELMGVAANKVHVAYNGVDSSFLDRRAQPGQDELLPAGLVPGEYVLFVGTFEARKNIERLIEAFALFKQRSGAAKFKLAIAGKPSSGAHSNRGEQINALIDRLGMHKEVILCGFVPDQQLPRLYQNACVIAFPSLYEGFGLPIVEGFASGVPVLTSDMCSMPEIAGQAALLSNPYDVQSMGVKLETLVFDSLVRERLIAAGYQRAREFTWGRCANRIIEPIKRLSARKYM